MNSHVVIVCILPVFFCFAIIFFSFEALSSSSTFFYLWRGFSPVPLQQLVCATTVHRRQRQRTHHDVAVEMSDNFFVNMLILAVVVLLSSESLATATKEKSVDGDEFCSRNEDDVSCNNVNGAIKLDEVEDSWIGRNKLVFIESSGELTYLRRETSA